MDSRAPSIAGTTGSDTTTQNTVNPPSQGTSTDKKSNAPAASPVTEPPLTEVISQQFTPFDVSIVSEPFQNEAANDAKFEEGEQLAHTFTFSVCLARNH